MNKVIPLLAFSVLLLVPVGAQNAYANEIFTSDCNNFGFGKTIFQPGDSICVTGNLDFLLPGGEIIPDGDIHIVPDGSIGPGIIFDDINAVSIFSVNTGPVTFGAGTFIDFFLTTANPTIPPGTYNVILDEDENGEFNIVIDAISLVSFQVLTTQSESCSDGIDNDGDGLVDGDDSECQNNGVIGGEIIPIDATSLILAGTQSFSWMLPLVLSILGIGLFITSRKNEN